MQRLSTLSRRTKVVLVATLALGLAGSVTGVDPAAADPKQFTAAVGVGSDTTQDVVNALAGFANGTNFTPVQSTDASKRQVVSWDAVGTTCITPKAPGATFLRPERLDQRPPGAQPRHRRHRLGQRHRLRRQQGRHRPRAVRPVVRRPLGRRHVT